MKKLIKRHMPFAVWEALRRTYSRARRLVLDVRNTASPAHPLEWFRTFRLVRVIYPRYSMVPATRMRLLHDLSRAIVREQVAGAIVECGVYNGGSAAMMVAAQPDERDVWLFDSFEGLPPPTENDGMYERNHYYPGWCGGTVEMVQEIFRTLRLPSGKQHVERGWFQETFPRVAPQVGPIALLHIDADWYDSVKICLDTFYPKVASGGYIVFDDYGTFSGCRKAVNEYFEKHKMTVTLETRDGVGRYFKKP